ncbi:hypothetical protein TNCV_665741 [Trichonephila clavipes]|uniref:Uncharacterized protein n=1 Tax=Trichonephila clavipes TaxID=2585209 RepID=A0A8X6SU53_TRICX|nr:hypothetical protein TNCV_665741 [Trichonephila clavipes]
MYHVQFPLINKCRITKCSFHVTRHDAGRRRTVHSPNLEESILNIVADRPSQAQELLLFSYTRAFGDGPRNFEPWSSDVDDT